MKIRKLLVSVAMIGATLAMGSMAVSAANPFNDIQDTGYADDVDFVYNRGIMVGTSDNTFTPNRAVTRGEFVAMLGRFAKENNSTSTTKFIDVKPDNFFAPYVNWAAEKGIVAGVNNKEFRPNDPVTREQIAAMMARYAKYSRTYLAAESEVDQFSDGDKIAGYAQKAVYDMKDAGILMGKGNNLFAPQAPTKRGEAAAIFHRYINYKEDKAPDTAVVTIEKFVLGQGFILKPTIVAINDKTTADDVIKNAAERQGIELNYDPKYFYLTGVEDATSDAKVNVPEFVIKELENDPDVEYGLDQKRNQEGFLSEFDYSTKSGWRFAYNNESPAVGADNQNVAANDVVRFHFSLLWGKDSGFNDSYTTPLFHGADKDALITKIAWTDENDSNKEAYTKAMTVLENLTATQKEVDEALAALQ